ncbi:MAG: GspE/PulE family protein [Candidatus Pacebacteria bacterium]|nr:GspE/PulE family protein [Candidatus Paceibacterota bacterium]
MSFLTKKLVDNKIIDAEQAAAVEAEVAKNPAKTEEEILVARGMVGEEELFQIKSATLGVPFVAVQPEDISLEVLKTIPEETAKFYRMIPLGEKKSQIIIGMVSPEDFKAQEALKFLARKSGFSYEVVLITARIFNTVLGKYRDLKKEVGAALEEFQEEETETETTRGKQTDVASVEEAPIAKIVNVIIRNAIDGNASDIHIEPSRTKLRVRFRVMGELYSSLFLPLNIATAVLARIKIMSNMKIDENRVPQDGRFSMKLESKSMDFRVSTLPTALGEKVVMRILDPDVGFKTFEDLGLDGRNLELMRKAIDEPFGLILVTGPTGSGKSTTLYAVLQEVNNDKVNIISLEDPVEYFCDGVNQSQVRPEIGFDFASGLRSILRQDPDIIMVGEVRDEETAMLTIHSSLTGHLVLSTLHTNDSLGVVPRLVDLKVQNYLIPSTLTLAIAQRLVRRLCPDCKRKVPAKGYLKEKIVAEFKDIPVTSRGDLNTDDPLYVWEPVGCPKCNRQGFSGRVGIFEALEMTPELGEIVLTSLSEQALKAEGRRQGLITMRQDGVLKAMRGVTTIEEVLKATEEDIMAVVNEKQN